MVIRTHSYWTLRLNSYPKMDCLVHGCYVVRLAAVLLDLVFSPEIAAYGITKLGCITRSANFSHVSSLEPPEEIHQQPSKSAFRTLQTCSCQIITSRAAEAAHIELSLARQNQEESICVPAQKEAEERLLTQLAFSALLLCERDR